jgi:hypothetical protein
MERREVEKAIQKQISQLAAVSVFDRRHGGSLEMTV